MLSRDKIRLRASFGAANAEKKSFSLWQRAFFVLFLS